MMARPMMRRLFPYGVLIFMGIGWGSTQPMAKLAISTGHSELGLIFWQLVIAAFVLAVITLIRRRPLPINLRVLPYYLVIALVGTIVPGIATFQALAHLDSGIVSLLLSIVPMLAFPVALALGVDRFSLKRLGGLALGLCAVFLLSSFPAALGDAGVLIYIPIALIAPLMYSFEGNFVARFGTGGTDPIQLLLGAAVLGAILIAPIVFATGNWISPLRPWGVAEWSILGLSSIHAIIYSLYVFSVNRFGPVFAVQVGYLVTAFGMIWAMILLGERYQPIVWFAFVLMIGGIYLVTPRKNDD